MLRRYCMVLEIKNKYVVDYVKIHKNPWPELLKAEKSSGIKEELIWIYKNLSIIYFECEDIEKVFKILADNEIEKKWNLKVGSWFKGQSDKDHLVKVNTLEKIFDLNQQINGELKKF